MNTGRNRWVRWGLAGVLAVSIAGGTVVPTYAHDRMGPPAGQMGQFGGGRGAQLATIAEALGMSEADLQSALQTGKSVAAIAQERQVALNTVVAALMADYREQLQQAVTAGRLTQAQADARLAELQRELPTRLSQSFQPGERGLGRGGRAGMGGMASMATIAQTLGITESELITALQAGKSVAAIATERQIDLNRVINAVVTEQTTLLNQAVAEGRLTQAQADQMLATLRANLPHLLNLQGGMGLGFGPRGFGGGRGMGPGRGPGAVPGQPSTPDAAPEAPADQQENNAPAAPVEGRDA
jgi:AraC-like DNA-binding protein